MCLQDSVFRDRPTIKEIHKDVCQFKNRCMKVYDVKDDSGHVYAQVVPGLDSYTLIKPNGSVVAVESKTAHIVTAIFKRWW